MQTKTPVRHHHGQTGDFGILLANLRRSLTSQEIKINDTAKDVVFKVLLTVLDVNLDINTRAGKKEDTVSAALSTVLEVDRVGSKELVSCRENAVEQLETYP